MKRYLTLPNLTYFLCLAFLLNSYLLVKSSPYFLFLVLPLFVLCNLLPGSSLRGTKSLRLKLCHHGTAVLFLFVCTLIPSLLWHVYLAFRMLPNAYLDLLFSALYCVVASALLFWNGILCVYLTSTQMGLK